jgi:hypothetical protein
MASKKKQEEARQDAPRDGRKDAPAKTTAKSVGDTASEVGLILIRAFLQKNY